MKLSRTAPFRWRFAAPLVLAVIGFAAASLGCGDETVAPNTEALAAVISAFGLEPLPLPEYPQYNRRVPERIQLGWLLFFDPILGGESAPWVKSSAGLEPYRYRGSDVACATCHHPRFGFGDGRTLAAGAGTGLDLIPSLGPERRDGGESIVTSAPIPLVARNSLTVLNAALNGNESAVPKNESLQFIDGRVTLGLEVQALFPLTVRAEMAGDAYGRDVLGDRLTSDAIRDSITARIRAIPGYLDRFRRAYPDEITEPGDIRLTHITKAIAAYERELTTPGSRYDRFVAGEFTLFTEQERSGFTLFFGKAGCGGCHFGPMLSDYSFHVQGVPDVYPPGFEGKDGAGHDFGRYHADPMEHAHDKYAFRTLTIRNVELSAPFFHSGSASTLRDVVEFYDSGGQRPEDISDATLAAAGAVRSPLIQPLGLSAHEIAAVVAFLRTTTGRVAPGPGGVDLTRPPDRVPSGLVPPGAATPEGRGPFLPLDSTVGP
jgi:cytochrome c peroxidase